jgi:hypothetical protein
VYERLVILFVEVFYLYAALGTAFTIAFETAGVKRLDPKAIGSGFEYRVKEPQNAPEAEPARAGIRDARYSNCFRKAANCCCSSPTTLRSSELSFRTLAISLRSAASSPSSCASRSPFTEAS